VKILNIILVICCLITITGNAKNCNEQEICLSTDSLQDVPESEFIALDNKIFYDGNGSLRITVPENKEKKVVIPLYEISNVKTLSRLFAYQARLKAKDIKGKVYLEMLCTVNGKGPYFSRDIKNFLNGDSKWELHKIPFYLNKDSILNKIQLNLIFEGTGTCWIDELKIVPLKYWFNPLKYSKVPGMILGVLGAILGFLCAFFLPRGQGRFCLKYCSVAMIICIMFFAFGMLARNHAQPREIWYNFAFSGALGLIIFGTLNTIISKQVKTFINKTPLKK